MKIIINTNALLHPLTGIGQYTYQLSKKLKEVDAENDYCYYYGYFSKALLGGTNGSRIWIVRSLKKWFKKIPLVGRWGRPLRTKANRFLQKFFRYEFDLYFEPNFIPLPEIHAKKTVTMVFDLSAVLYPEWHPKERVEVFRREFASGIARSDMVITATQFMKRQIMDNLQVPESKIAVVPIDCNKQIFGIRDPQEAERFRKQEELPEKYLMFVGNIEPRKNILLLLKAFLMQGTSGEDLGLVFCGPAGWKNGAVFDFIRQNDLMGRIRLMHYVTEKQLCLLYNRAQALVYPSFYEGFGLPPLEAMSSGCPVIVSDIQVHREVCGDAVLYADPKSPEQMAEAIRRILEEPGLADDLRKKGLEQAAKFSWENTARETLKIFDQVSRGASVPSEPASTSGRGS